MATKKERHAVSYMNYGLSVDHNARNFAAAEQIISVYNVIMGSFYAFQAVKSTKMEIGIKQHQDKKETYEVTEDQKFMDIVSNSMLAVGLLTQGILGYFLHSAGYTERNICFCCVWVIASGFNLINFIQVMIIHWSEMHSSAGVEYDMMTSQIYLLYNIPGIVIMTKFVNLLRHQSSVEMARKDSWDDEKEEEKVKHPAAVLPVKVTSTTEMDHDSHHPLHHPLHHLHHPPETHDAHHHPLDAHETHHHPLDDHETHHHPPETHETHHPQDTHETHHPHQDIHETHHLHDEIHHPHGETHTPGETHHAPAHPHEDAHHPVHRTSSHSTLSLSTHHHAPHSNRNPHYNYHH